MLDRALILALVLQSCLGGFPYQGLSCNRIVFTCLCLPGLRKMSINPPGLKAAERQTVPFLPWSPAHRHIPALLNALLSQSYSFFIEVEAVKWGKESGCLLGGDNFYLNFIPSLCTQFKMTKQEETLIFVVIVVLSFLVCSGL